MGVKGLKSSSKQDLSRFLRWKFLRFAGPLNIFVPFLVLVDKKKSWDEIWDRRKKHKIANSEETAFVTPLFKLLNVRQEKRHKLWTF